MSDEPKATDEEPAKIESAKNAELRVQSHPDTPLPIDTKKSKKKLIIILIVLFAFLAIAVAVYYLYLVPTYFTPKVADNNGYENATKFKSSEKIIESVKPQLKGSTVHMTEMNGFGGKTTDGFGAYSVPVYRVGDRKYSNLPGASTGSSYEGSSTEASKNYITLVNFFKKNNFKELSSGKDTSGINQWFNPNLQYISYASYESNSQLCMIWHVDATPTSIKNHVTSIGCADKSSYEAAAKELDQFYTAYAKNSTGSGSDRVVLGMPLGAQGADNYINVTVYQEDPDQLDTQFQGLYYRTQDQKEWTYFTGAYGVLSCSEYNTDTLKKAFRGFNCWNDATKDYTTVI